MGIVGTSVAALSIGLNDGFISRIPEGYRDLASLHATWKWDCPNTSPLAIPTQNCLAGKPWSEAKIRGVLWGDSHAEHLLPLVHKAATDADLSVALLRTCIAIVHPNRAKIYNQPPECSFRERFTKLIRETPTIRFVILAGEWHAWVPQLYRNDGDERTSVIGFNIFKTELASFVDELASMNVKVLIASEIALFAHDPIPRILFIRRCTPTVTNYSRNYFDRNQRKYTEAIREISDRRKDVMAIIPTDGMCNVETCRTFVGSEFLYRDQDHIRRNLSDKAIAVLSEETGLSAAMNNIVSE